MKLDCENCNLPSATPEDVSRLIDNAEERGSFLSLVDEKDPSRFVQIEDCVDGFALEWRNGESSSLERSDRTLSPDEAKEVLLAVLHGDNVRGDHFRHEGTARKPAGPQARTTGSPKRTGFLLSVAGTILFLVLALLWRFARSTAS